MQFENGARDDDEEDDNNGDDAGDDDDERVMTMLLADLDFIGCSGNKSLLFTSSIVNFQAILVILNHSHDIA